MTTNNQQPITKLSLFKFTFMFLSLFIITGCEKDLYEDEIKNSQREIKTELLTGESARFIGEKLKKSLRKKYNISDASSSRIEMASIGEIVFDEVMQVEDSLGKKTYTFRVNHPDEAISKFYNLVLQEKAQGNIVKLFEYTMTDEFGQTFAQTFNYKDFRGTLSSFTIINETPCPDEDIILVNVGNIGDNIGGGSPGGDYPIGGGSNPPGSGSNPSGSNGSGSSSSSGSNPGGSSSSGSSSGSGGGSGGGIVSVVDTYLNLIITCIGSGGSWDYTDGNCIANPRYFRMAIDPKAIGIGDDVPCNPVYHIGILIPMNECEKSFMNALSNENKQWFYLNQRSNLGNEITEYMNSVTCEDETEKVFINEIINQIRLNPNVFTSITPFIIEKKIDDTQLDDCTKGIISLLKNLQQKDIAKLFNKLNNPNMVLKPWYTTKIVIEDPINSPNALAQTNWVAIPLAAQPGGYAVQSPFNYIIRIRPSYLNGSMLSSSSPPKKPTKLSIARTILHELIHAYLDSLFDDCNYSVPGGCAEIKSFEDLWQDYIIQKNGGTNPDDAQHLVIAKNFTNILARALQEFQTGNPVPDNIEPEQDYKDLAWYGLQGNYPNPNPNSIAQKFNIEYPLGSNKRDRFNKINDAENKQETSNANGLITPKNTPCE